MDCKNAQILLLFYRPDRPDDLEPTESTALRDHLSTCTACAQQLARNTVQDHAIGQALRSVPTPTGLAEKLKARVAADRNAQWRRTVTKYAIAASLLLMTYGGYVAATRPYLNVEQLAETEDSLWQSPEQSTTDWLAANGLSAAIPVEYDLQQATFHGRRNLHGIPTLAVRLDSSARNRAWVYFVRSRDFNLSKVENGQFTSNVAVRVHQETGSKWTVLVVYTGNNLNSFLRPNQGVQ